MPFILCKCRFSDFILLSHNLQEKKMLSSKLKILIFWIFWFCSRFADNDLNSLQSDSQTHPFEGKHCEITLYYCQIMYKKKLHFELHHIRYWQVYNGKVDFLILIIFFLPKLKPKINIHQMKSQNYCQFLFHKEQHVIFHRQHLVW